MIVASPVFLANQHDSATLTKILEEAQINLARGKLVERCFADECVTGGSRRTWGECLVQVEVEREKGSLPDAVKEGGIPLQGDGPAGLSETGN